MRKVIGILGVCMSGLLYGQPLTILKQPEDITVCPWEDAVFTVEVDNTGRRSHHALNWSMNGSVLDPNNMMGLERREEVNGTTMVATFFLTVPNTTYPDFINSRMHLTIVDINNLRYHTNSESAALKQFYVLKGTLTENHHTSNQTIHINWQPLLFLNSSDIRYSLAINDLTTGVPVDCDDCRFTTESDYSFAPDHAFSGHELDYTVSFDYCLREGLDEGVEQLLSLDLEALPTHQNIVFNWTLFFTQFGGLELYNDFYNDFYNIRLSDINDSSHSIQDQVSGHTYTFTPKPEKICNTFNFEVKAGVSPFANITGKTITAALTDLGEPEISVSQQDDQQVLVQLTSPASLHRITLTNSTDQIADVVTPEKQQNFSVAQKQQTILVSVTPENCPGMSAATTLFVTKAPSMESNSATGVYQGMIMAAITASSFLLTQWLNRP